MDYLVELMRAVNSIDVPGIIIAGGLGLLLGIVISRL
jgi:hypothetical protein